MTLALRRHRVLQNIEPVTRGLGVLRILEFSRVILLILRLVDEETFFAISYRFGYKLVIPLPHTHTHTHTHHTHTHTHTHTQLYHTHK
ncbi:hypothetical protein WDU94_002361 [Cyamophila willieti]